MTEGGGHWRRWRDAGWAWLLRDTYAIPVDLFRICAGLLSAAYFAVFLVQAPDFSSPDGLLDHALLQRVFWFTRESLFQAEMGEPLFSIAYVIGIVGSLAIAIGSRVRLWAVVCFLIAVSAYRWTFIVMNVDDALMHLVPFWLIVLPAGRTLVLTEYLREGRAAWRRWVRTTVPGAPVACLLGNMCLLYLVAGLWKLESPFWRSGFALYATLRTPIGTAPDFWGPQHLPLLRVSTYAAFLVEPLLPVLLLQRPWHPLKWVGLVCLLGFHVGIIATVRVPFANLACLAAAILFFREEIGAWCLRHTADAPARGSAATLDRAGRVALAVLIALTVAMVRRLPVIGEIHMPAYAALWVAGFAQDYQLFNWIDRKNFHLRQELFSVAPHGLRVALDPATLIPPSPKGVLLQAYLHDVRWIQVPPEAVEPIKRSILDRLAQRYCRLHPPHDGRIVLFSIIQRITPANVALTRGQRRFVMEFRCRDGRSVMCTTLMARDWNPECNA